MARPLRSILWDLRALWLTLALMLAVDIALRPIVMRPRPRSTDPLINHARAPQPAPVLLIGSSRFRRVSSADVARGSGGPGLLNVSFNGGSLDTIEQLARRFLTAETLAAGGTRLLLIGVGPMDVNDAYRSPLAASLTWSFADFFRHLGQHGTDAETRVFLFETPPARWSSLLYAYRHNQLRAEVRTLGLRLTGRLQRLTQDAPAATDAPAPPADGADDEALNQQTQRAKGARAIEQVPPPLSSVYLRDFRVGGRQADALRRLVERLRPLGVHVALVHGPVSDWYAQTYLRGEDRQYAALLRQLGEALDIPVFLLPRQAYGIVDADYFRPDGFDGHHLLSASGRAAFSEGIGRHVLAPLWAELQAGRPPRFAQSRFELHP